MEAFQKIRTLYENRRMTSGPIHPIDLRLTSFDSPECVTFEALRDFVDYARERLDISLELTGGGVGCFDMRLSSNSGDPEILRDAITSDAECQRRLNDLNVHLVRVRSQQELISIAAHSPMKAVLATTRKRAARVRSDDPPSLFGAEDGRELSYGLVDYLVRDFSSGQSKPALAKRLWREIKLLFGDARASHFEVEVEGIKLIGADAFEGLIGRAPAKGIATYIHGFANSFPTALSSFGAFVYRSRLEQLELLPVMFSWPSRGSPAAYAPDVESAENSELRFEELLAQIARCAGDKKLSLIAHSHGNKILVTALHAASRDKRLTLDRIALVAADVNAAYFEDRAAALLAQAGAVAIYYATDDRALALSQKAIWRSPRVGRGVAKLSAGGSTPSSLELIDATAVSSGPTRHGYHIDAIEVVRDIHDFLRGDPPGSRMSIEPVLGQGAWRVRRA